MSALIHTIAVAATLAIPQARLRAQSVDSTLDLAIAAYAKVKTVRANMEQELYNPLTGSRFVSRGQISQRRPNRLEIRFTDPRGDRIVADGKFVWVYTPSTNPGQAYKLPLGAGAAGSTDLMAELFTNPRAKFTITDGGTRTEKSRVIQALVLVPKADAGIPSDFAQAKVWVDTVDGIIREFEITDASGVVRHVKLSAMKLNGAIPSSAFVFKVPKGVQLFEQP